MPHQCLLLLWLFYVRCVSAAVYDPPVLTVYLNENIADIRKQEHNSMQSTDPVSNIGQSIVKGRHVVLTGKIACFDLS